MIQYKSKGFFTQDYKREYFSDICLFISCMAQDRNTTNYNQYEIEPIHAIGVNASDRVLLNSVIFAEIRCGRGLTSTKVR